MNTWQQANNAMRFKMAHGLWLAQKISAIREGREFDQPEPKIEGFTREEPLTRNDIHRLVVAEAGFEFWTPAA